MLGFAYKVHHRARNRFLNGKMLNYGMSVGVHCVSEVCATNATHIHSAAHVACMCGSFNALVLNVVLLGAEESDQNLGCGAHVRH